MIYSFPASDRGAIRKQAEAADDDRNKEDQQGKRIVSHAQRVAADGGGDDGGDGGDGADDQPAFQRQIGEPHHVAEQILRRSRKEEQEKDPQGKLLLVLQDGQGVELLQREEHLHRPGPEAPHQQEHGYPSQESAEQAQQRPFQRAEGVARRDLQGLARDGGHDDLEDQHPQEGDGGHDALFIHPGPELLRLLGESYEGCSGKEEDQCGEEEEQEDARSRDPLFLFFCEAVVIAHGGVLSLAGFLDAILLDFLLN